MSAATTAVWLTIAKLMGERRGSKYGNYKHSTAEIILFLHSQQFKEKDSFCNHSCQMIHQSTLSLNKPFILSHIHYS